MKKTIGMIFGGQSSEHEISCLSAITIISNIDSSKYQPLFIGITKEGKWLYVNSVEDIQSGAWKNGKERAFLLPDATKQSCYLINDETKQQSERKIDVLFPVLHGIFGEDGTIQGLFEMTGIPYVGCGVLASAICMDKIYTKMVVDTISIRQADYVAVRKKEWEEPHAVVAKIEERLAYPVFIKPSKAGSSCGVSKAINREELQSGIKDAFLYDDKILVEETIVGREIECAVLEKDGELQASGVGEIITEAEFYDYQAKYQDTRSKTVVSPQFPEGVEEGIQDAAIRIFRAVDGNGLARVDFFLKEGSNELIFNEINTLPGFTEISMYPMLWKEKGVSLPELIEVLIQSAFKRKA